MKRRDFNRIALGIGLSPILANTAVTQVTGQTETFTQAPPKNGVLEMSTNDPMAAVRQYINAFNKGDATVMAATFAVPGFLTACHRTYGRGQRPLRIGTETCWLKASNMVLQIISSLWASRCITTLPVTAPM
jgi:hypothetical protein